MSYNYLTPLAEMRPTGGAGFGSFAVSPIPAGTIVACFGGEQMNRITFNTQDTDRRARSIQIETDSFLLGPVVREPGDAVNHSCAPNCGMGGAAQVVAMVDIAVGAELNFDYAMADDSDYDEFECACGTPLCRGTVRGADWRRPELQQRYRGYLSPYIMRKIRAEQTRRPLGKRDVEHLMASYDTAPRLSLQTALQIISGRATSSFETLIELIDFTASRNRGLSPLAEPTRLVRGDTESLDALVSYINEARSIDFK